MTRTELLGSTSPTVVPVTAPGPNALHVGRAVWDKLAEPRERRLWPLGRRYSGTMRDMLRQVRNSEVRLAEEKEMLIFSNARRTGKTFAMEGMKLQVQIDDGLWMDVDGEAYAAEGTDFHREAEAMVGVDYSTIEDRVLAVYGMPDLAKPA